MAKKDESKKTRKKKDSPESTPSEQPNWRQWLDTLSKASLFLLATIYLAGFLVITIAFTKMGVPPLISPVRYLSAGLVPLVVISSAWFLVRRAIISSNGRKRLFPGLKALFKSMFFLLVLVTLVFILLDMMFGFPFHGKPLIDPGIKIDLSTIPPLLIIPLVSLPLLILLVFDGLVKYFSLRNPKLSRLFADSSFYFQGIMAILLMFIIKPGFQLTGLWIILSVLLFYTLGPEWEMNPKSTDFSTIWPVIWLSLSSILFYGAWVYPMTSPLIGGGRPFKIIAYTSQHPLHHKLQVLPDSIIRIEAELLNKTGNEYILRIEDSLGQQHIVEIGKDKIESIIYLTPKEIKARQAQADSLEEIKKLEGEMMGPFPPDSLSSKLVGADLQVGPHWFPSPFIPLPYGAQ